MAEIGKQIHAEVEDKVGKLAELTDKIAEAGVNILAVAAWAEGQRGHILLVTDDNEKACQAIRPVVANCEFKEAICVNLPNEVGALGKVAHKLAEAGIGIEMMHASAAGAAVLAVLGTSDNARAAELI